MRLYYKPILFTVALGVLAAPAFAQFSAAKQVAKSAAQVGAKRVPSAGGLRPTVQLERAAKKAQLGLYQFSTYSPVLGYPTRFTPKALRPELGASYDPIERIQVAPKTRRSVPQTSKTFTPRIQDTTLPQITQGIYLWRLANPGEALQEQSSLVQHARELAESQQLQDGYPLFQYDVMQRPVLKFLERLLDPSFTPKTYAQLAAETIIYPKHVTLDEAGFPVPTKQAQKARELDNYLMLSHPYFMWMFDSATLHENYYTRPATYTGFVLTPEERRAADELLALRQQSIKVPANPTVRDLLEISYNLLNSHTLLYIDPEMTAWYNAFYLPFPHYSHTQLYRSIKEVLNKAEGSVWRHSTDISHLTVLDAIMGGIENESVSATNQALDAFEKLCKETPYTPQRAAHLKILKANLLQVPGVDEFLHFDVVRDRGQYEHLTLGELNYLKERVTNFKEKKVEDLMHP